MTIIGRKDKAVEKEISEVKDIIKVDGDHVLVKISDHQASWVKIKESVKGIRIVKEII